MVVEQGYPERPLTRTTQRWLQLAWLVVILPEVAAYAVGMWNALQTPSDICAEMGPGCTEAAVSV